MIYSQAIEAAITDFEQRDTTADVYGYNDCYTFVSTYIHYLTGDSLPAFEYKDTRTFLRDMNIKTSAEIIIKAANLKRINSGISKHGDVAILDMGRRFGLTALINKEGYWVTSAGTKGIITLAKVKKLENRLQLLCRPGEIKHEILL